MTRLPGVRLLRAAKLLLDARDVERFVEPAIAELQHECRQDHAAWAARWAPILRIVGMLVYLSGRARVRRTTRVGWYAFLPALLAVFLGVLLMRGAGVPGNVAGLQAGWLLVGLTVAWVIATTPRRLLERAAVLLGCLSVAALVATAIFGAPMASAARWATLGSVRVQTSLLVLPCITVALATAFARGSVRLAFGLAVAAQLALIAQPDGATSVLVAVAAITAAIGAGTMRWRSLAWMGAALAAAAVVALVRDPHIPIVAHVEGVFSLPGSPLLKLAALAALLLVPAYPVALAFRARRSEGPVRAAALALAATNLASIAIPAFGPYPVPLVGYGGSGVMACMIGLAFVLAHEPEADDRSRAS